MSTSFPIRHIVYDCVPGAFAGGVQKMVFELASAQRRLGADVEIWAPNAIRKGAVEDHDGLPIRYFNSVGFGHVVKSKQIVQELKFLSPETVLHAHIEWRAGTADASGNNLVVTETRTLKISRSGAGAAAQVDASFKLKPARDLKLDGNVQHAGVHMRVSHQVVDRADDVSYLWSPEGAPTAGKGYSKKATGAAGSVVGKDLKWGEFLFPLHGRWYSAVQMNAPSNPVEEFSTREYGRFGFFFAKGLKKNEELALNYRFIVRNAENSAEAPKRSAAQKAKVRADADAAYAKFLRESK